MSSTHSRRSGDTSRATRASRRSTILHGAGQLFSEVGYDRASMESIAHITGVTKVTVYAHFHDKARLFTSALEHLLAQLPQPVLEADPQASLNEQLALVARELLRQNSHPASLTIARMFARSLAAPGMPHSERWQQRYQPYQQYLEQVLAQRCQCDNPTLAAQQFLILVIGILDLPNALLETTSHADQLERALAAVDVFVRAYPQRDYGTSSNDCRAQTANPA